MKKMLKFAAGLLVAGALLVSCASTGSSSKASTAAGTGIPHPRSYEIDPADVTATLDMAYNQYGPNYQGVVDFYKPFLKADKPQAGDTVKIKMKITADLEIPGLAYYIIDNSPAANYWTVLSGDNYIENLKPGEYVEIEQDVVLTESVKGGFQIVFGYDGADHGQDQFAKAGAASKFSFEKIGETTNTIAEAEAYAAANGVAEAPKGPQTYNIAIEKVAAFFQLETNHPWVDGVQDMSQISNYQGIAHFTTEFGEDLPKAGDTIHATWHATSDVDIKNLHIRVIENSAAVNWWAEISEAGGTGYVLIEDVKANEAFDVSIDIPLVQDAQEDISFCIWADVGDVAQPATIIMARD
ncbi:MAG: hypothetical protein K5866_03365 [Treponema sp.]|nr:hypothetical protein [Treponema sp.]